MPQAELSQDRLTDYERAICYYTLPKVITPVTYGIVLVYTICLFEAIAALIIGVLLQHGAWTTGGATALGVIVVLGLLLFFVRALLNEIRQRKTLALAKGVPNAFEVNEGFPDPFANHLLIKHPLDARGRLFSCTEQDDTIVYFVDSAPNNRWWKVKTPQDEEVCRIKALSGIPSFSLGVGTPGVLGVYAGGDEIARITRRFSFKTPWVEICCEGPEPRTFSIRQEGIIFEGKLVGRVYSLHRAYYLDIDKDVFNEGLLAYFITRV